MKKPARRQPKTGGYTFLRTQVTPELRQIAEEVAAAEGVSLSALLARALDMYLVYAVLDAGPRQTLNDPGVWEMMQKELKRRKVPKR